MASLRDKTISGIFWSFLQKVGSRGISFVVMIILARLLTPKDFGLIGMLMIFIEVSQAAVEGGFNLALIQKKDTDELDYSSVFWINLVVSIILYMIVFICAPFIADFYDQPILAKLVRVFSVVFVINAFSIVQEARLTKDIQFKTLMLVHLPSAIIGGIVSILMAFKGFGVWSLLAYQVVNRLAYAVQIWIYARWQPQFRFQWQRIKALFSFGSKLLITRIFTTIYNNLLLVIIGKFFPLRSVGYYQNASNLVNAPSNTITSVINTVTFPVFSSVQDDDNKLKSGYRRTMQQAFFWICPAYILAGVLAIPLFDFVFGPKWLPAVPYFRWLCIVGIVQPLKTYNLNIINVKGRSDLFLKLQLIWKIITLIGILIAIPFGIIALLMVQAISYVFAFILFSYYSGRFINYELREQIGDIAPTFFLSIGVGLAVLFFNHLTGLSSSALRLFLGFGTGAGLYGIIAYLFKFSPLLEFRQIAYDRFFSRFPR